MSNNQLITNIECKCDNPDCSKCLGINCIDIICPIHTPENKIKTKQRVLRNTKNKINKRKFEDEIKRLQKFINKEKHPILEDLVDDNLKIIFCGMAPGRLAAELQQYYSHPGNRFWNILREAKFTNKIITSKEYKKLINNKIKIGLTDLVKDQVGGDNNITVTDDDCSLLEEKIIKYKPKVLAFNGKKSAEEFFNKNEINYGKVDNIGKTSIWVLESTAPTANRWWNNGKHWKQLAQKFI